MTKTNFAFFLWDNSVQVLHCLKNVPLYDIYAKY